MPGGRPTDYRPEHCDAVVEAGRKGKTLTWFAASIGQGRRTIYQWMAAHPAFAHACERARAAFQAYWEDRLGTAFADRNQNSNAMLSFMAATCEDFRPQAQRIEISGPGGGAIPLKPVSDDELLRLAGPILDAEVLPPAALPAAPDDPDPKPGE